MTEYTTKGTIITLPYKSSDLTTGSVCIVLLDDVYYRITLLHMNEDGNWLVDDRSIGVTFRGHKTHGNPRTRSGGTFHNIGFEVGEKGGRYKRDQWFQPLWIKQPGDLRP